MNLQNIAKQLKSEFIGIDYVIDRLVDSVKTWIDTDRMNSPTVICLWGMTGCGKTHLVKRFLELSKLSDESFYFNMVDRKKLGDALGEVFKQENHITNPKSVFIFDEFQNCNTQDEMTGARLDREDLCSLWDLLDSGKFSEKKYIAETWRIYAILRDIEVITKGKCENFTVKQMKIRNIKQTLEKTLEKTPNDFLEESDMQILDYEFYYRLMNKRKLCTSLFDTESREQFDNLTMKKLMELYNNNMFKSVNVEFDFSKSLIFVLGNLDNLYAHSTEIESDCDADLLYENSKHLTPQDTKRILTSLFKPEQISRLGNNHIIYKAFSKHNYDMLIRKYLQDVNKRFEVNVNYDQSVVDMIYKEGVFPSQGVRPIISTIKYTIENNIKIITNGYSKDEFEVVFKKGCLVAGNKKIKLNLINSITYITKNDDIYKRICVHEAGHAFMTLKLAKKYPRNVVIKLNSKIPTGISESENSITSRTPKDLRNEICVCLGGMIAEQIVFGEITSGNMCDRENITDIVNHYLLSYGMDESSLLFNTKHEYSPRDCVVKNVLEDGKRLTEQCYLLTNQIFMDNMKEFKMIVKELYEKQKLKQEDFKRMFPNIEEEKNNKFEMFLGEEC